jgi:glyoxylase-like metal-dependent hydrolase (beta-lactamase superfamily II)
MRCVASTPVENWFAALDRIVVMDVDTIVPGHGPITDKRGAQQAKEYWTHIVAQVRHRYDAGMSAKQAAYEIVRSPDFHCQPFAQWDSPERLLVSAHTLYRKWRALESLEPHRKGRLDDEASNAGIRTAGRATCHPASGKQMIGAWLPDLRDIGVLQTSAQDQLRYHFSTIDKAWSR